MFSGLIKHTGVIVKGLEGKSEGQIVIEANLGKVEIGSSVAVNGACLTLTEIKDSLYTFFVSYETSTKSTISKLKPNEFVNLELPVTPSTFLDGHIVLGHVDTIGVIESIDKIGQSYKLTLSVPKDFMKYVVYKGSIAIDGISLTIYEFNDISLSIAVIPSTFNNTNLKYKKYGSEVNVEFDIIGKYVEKFLNFETSSLTIEKLKDFLGS
ncbi:MAG: riboflavin synthase [Brevinematia bacterium]